MLSLKKYPVILAIESSCDDTAVSIMKGDVVLSNIIGIQQVHNYYGGVVPELASRSHQKEIVPLIHQAIMLSNINKIDAIAFTRGPGLIGSLLVGSSFAKSLAIAWDIPIISVHHIQAHILAHFIRNELNSTPKFPFLCLTVSGGHTQIVQVDDYFKMTLLGKTIDDSVGEAFDKAAKILGLGYPGGIWIDRYAQKGKYQKFLFSKPQIKNLDFSFSGFKTQFLYFIRKKLQYDSNFIRNNIHDICASVQSTLVNILFDKVSQAIYKTGIFRIALSGGVSANSGLRRKFLQASNEKNWKLHLLPLEYTTDNAAMIAMTAKIKYIKGIFDNINITPTAICDWDNI
ncbi:glycoprotease family protein [Candidatus Walczuchella monophlebidarum]|uniref:tRNA N6-adenosine threonylcarbamoyltransferase n=1 Tax=Candidatus Walczuchella monophlebidarum TaxID=1415657 RepID=A0A068DQE9_9FLAO|nr:tRNA (adenosine(37)-N6)-threonylcarbamoyltransferase complex transferase subunit TsaD [Candidatus Walczuchella monophlebidarum]AID37467.1 glycoprotease family protein [Candidatus Walczuchella monophlebidarum]